MFKSENPPQLLGIISNITFEYIKSCVQDESDLKVTPLNDYSIISLFKYMNDSNIRCWYLQTKFEFANEITEKFSNCYTNIIIEIIKLIILNPKLINEVNEINKIIFESCRYQIYLSNILNKKDITQSHQLILKLDDPNPDLKHVYSEFIDTISHPKLKHLLKF